MKPDSNTALKPFRTNLKDVPKVGGLEEKDGWVNMQVQFLIDQKRANSDKLLVGWTVLPPLQLRRVLDRREGARCHVHR